MTKKILSLLVMLNLTACGVEQVDEGFRGIKKVWGKVEGGPLSPGLYFYNPISSDVFEMSVREEKVEEQTACFTKDTQTVHVTYAITYYPKPDMIGKIYSQFGSNWEEKTILPAVTGAIKDAIGQYIADDLVSKREAVKIAAFKEITDSLAERDVIVKKLDLVNLDFEDDYEKAVERKVVAIQKAEEAKNKTVEVAEQKKQTILSAEAQAQSMRIRAQALTQNKALVEYEAVQKWDGKLPQYILGNGAMPFINLKGLGK